VTHLPLSPLLLRIATVLLTLCLAACADNAVEYGQDGSQCVDPGALSHRQYSREGLLTRTETSVKLSFSLPGHTSHEARLSFTPYLSDPIAAALRKYAADHPAAVTPATGGLEKVNAWVDPVHSTKEQPVVVFAPQQGWFLVEPPLLDKEAEGGFFVECPASAHGAECIRHHNIAGRTVEIGMTDDDLQHWADADKAVRTALQSLLAPCMP
jgi:hypothetical protein